MSYNNRLEEKYIQTESIDFLQDFYRKCSHNNSIKKYAEVYTTAGNRADGLIVWENAPNDVRVVSLEAKAYNTISNLRSRWDKEKVSNWNRMTSELLLFIIVCLSFNFLKKHIVFEPALLILIFLCLYIIRKLTLPFLQRVFTPLLKTADVFEQAARYPGNEMWIAIGEDTFKMKKAEKLQELISQCKLRKFGLLEIPIGGGSPNILILPKFRPARQVDNFLNFYKKGLFIRKEIEGNTVNFLRRWKLSGAEKRYNRNNLALSVGITILLGIFSLSSGNFWNKPISNPNDYITETHTFSTPIPQPTLPIISVPKIEKGAKKPPLTNAPTECSMPFNGSKYILKDNLFTTQEAAKKRVQLLKKAGCPGCGYFWIPCSDWQEQQELWCVYAYNHRNNRPSIVESEENYRYKLRTAGLKIGTVGIWKVGEK